MSEDITYNKSLRNAQFSILPPLEQQTLQIMAKKRHINFNMILSLPFLLKEQGIDDRKDSIAVFRRRKYETIQPHKIKVDTVNPGRIFVNEFWSDKYQNKVLCDSQITSQLNSYKHIVKDNINQYLSILEDQFQRQFIEAREQLLLYIRQKIIPKPQDSLNDLDSPNIRNCAREDLLKHYSKQSFMKSSVGSPYNLNVEGPQDAGRQINKLIHDCDKLTNRKPINKKKYYNLNIRPWLAEQPTRKAITLMDLQEIKTYQRIEAMKIQSKS